MSARRSNDVASGPSKHAPGDPTVEGTLLCSDCPYQIFRIQSARNSLTVPLRRDEVTNRFGVQLTSAARTIADVVDIGADPSVVIEATGRAVATGLVSPKELRAAVRRRPCSPWVQWFAPWVQP